MKTFYQFLENTNQGFIAKLVGSQENVLDEDFVTSTIQPAVAGFLTHLLKSKNLYVGKKLSPPLYQKPPKNCTSIPSLDKSYLVNIKLDDKIQSSKDVNTMSFEAVEFISHTEKIIEEFPNSDAILFHYPKLQSLLLQYIKKICLTELPENIIEKILWDASVGSLCALITHVREFFKNTEESRYFTSSLDVNGSRAQAILLDTDTSSKETLNLPETFSQILDQFKSIQPNEWLFFDTQKLFDKLMEIKSTIQPGSPLIFSIYELASLAQTATRKKLTLQIKKL